MHETYRRVLRSALCQSQYVADRHTSHRITFSCWLKQLILCPFPFKNQTRKSISNFRFYVWTCLVRAHDPYVLGERSNIESQRRQVSMRYHTGYAIHCSIQEWIQLVHSVREQVDYRISECRHKFCFILYKGFILRTPVLDSPGVDEIYDDRKYWNISESGFPAITEEGNNQNGVNDKTM